MQIFDLHTHSYYSDGTESPKNIVETAKELGLAFVALSDHDTVLGVEEAVAAGDNSDIKVIAGIEIDVQHDTLLHIQGLGIDTDNERLRYTIKEANARREDRNARMLKKLSDAGYDIRERLEATRGTLTRLHMASALVAQGYAQSKLEAFEKYLYQGRVGYVDSVRISQKEAIDTIHEAGGIAVIAHPCKLRCEVHSLIRELVELGLDGIEALYPSSTEGQEALFVSMARQYGLMITCGSDFHGANRTDILIGCAWRDTPLLEAAFDYFSAY